VKAEDWPWTLLGLYPYKCESCQTRFRRMPSTVGSGVVLFVMLVVCYPLSYVVMEKYSSQNRVVQTIYEPLDWVLRSFRGNGVAANTPDL
jgi:hypothetical protein